MRRVDLAPPSRQAAKVQFPSKAPSQPSPMLLASSSSSAAGRSHLVTTSSSFTPQRSTAEAHAQKFAFFHLLATGPKTESEIIAKTKIPSSDLPKLLTRHARESLNVKGAWELQPACYKELDIWSFKYATQEERESAQANAIRAFDRLRISREDQLWQKLLPEDRRNKGVVLSKLNLGAGAGSLPADHRKMLAGAGGDMGQQRPLSGGGRNKNPLAHKSPMHKPAARGPSSPVLPKESKEAKQAAPKKSVAPKKSTAATKQFKSAEYVNDEDEDSEPDIPLSATKLDSKQTADVKAAAAKKAVHANETFVGKKRKTEAESGTPLPGDALTAEDLKRVKSSHKPSGSTPLGQFGATPTPTRATVADSKGTGSSKLSTIKRPQSRVGVAPAGVVPGDSSKQTSPISKATSGATSSKVDAKTSPKATAKRRVNGPLQQNSGRPNHVSKPSAETTLTKLQIQAATSPNVGARNHPKAPASDTSSSSRPSTVFSPASSPSQDHSSASSLASVAPAVKKARPSKRTAEPHIQHDSAKSSASGAARSPKRIKTKHSASPVDSSSSSPITPSSRMDHIANSRPGDISQQGPRSSRDAATSEDDALDLGRRLTNDQSTPRHEDAGLKTASPTPSATPPDKKQMQQFHRLQTTFLPAFTAHLHHKMSIGILPADLHVPEQLAAAANARRKMLEEMEAVKHLLRAMSPSTIEAVGLDPAAIKESIRLEGLPGAQARRWDLVPTHYSPDMVVGFRGYCVEYRESLKKQYLAHRIAFDKMRDGPGKEAERKWLLDADYEVEALGKVLHPGLAA